MYGQKNIYLKKDKDKFFLKIEILPVCCGIKT